MTISLDPDLLLLDEPSAGLAPDLVTEMFDEARSMAADLVVLGWDDGRPWARDKPQRSIDQLKREPPCDFLVLKDRGLDLSRVLVATDGRTNATLSAEVANALTAGVGAEVSLLHVVDSPAERAAGTEFLRSWAEENDLADAELLVDDSGDIERAIARASADHSLALLGATERGVLSRLVTDSLHLNVVDEVEYVEQSVSVQRRRWSINCENVIRGSGQLLRHSAKRRREDYRIWLKRNAHDDVLKNVWLRRKAKQNAEMVRLFEELQRKEVEERRLRGVRGAPAGRTRRETDRTGLPRLIRISVTVYRWVVRMDRRTTPTTAHETV